MQPDGTYKWVGTSNGKEGKAWVNFWNASQTSSDRDGSGCCGLAGYHVYFGHDANRGLQLEKKSCRPSFATGLDSGCVYGQQLSAMIVNQPSVFTNPRNRLVQVPARKAYCGGSVTWLMKGLAIASIVLLIIIFL